MAMLYSILLRDARSDWGNLRPDRGHYNLLVQGFAAGELSLRTEVPAGLAALPDPYDPTANLPYRQTFHLHDASFYRGKIYLYHGVAPALVLFGPYHWISGGYLPNKHAVWLFSIVGFLASAWLIRACWRRHFPHVPPAIIAALFLAVGLVNSVPQLVATPGTSEVAIACAYAFAMLACAALFRGLHSERSSVWLALASLSYGIAVAARPSLLFGAVILLVPLWPVRGAAPGRPPPTALPRFVAAFAPLLVIGIGLALYNYTRFGDVFEFGQRYQLAGDRQDAARHFSFDYAAFNFRLYFLQPLSWRGVFPFVQDILLPSVRPAGHAPVESAQGILVNFPFCLFAIAAWRRTAGLRPWRVLVAVLTTLFATSAVLYLLFYGTVLRYQAEFHPALTLLAALGVLALEGHRATRLSRTAWIAALLLSVTVSLLSSVKLLAEEYNRSAVTLAGVGDNAAATDALQAALRLKPDLVEAHTNLGFLQLARGDHTGALASYTEAVRLAPASATASDGLARSLAAAGRTSEAVDAYRALVALKPTSATAHANLATLLFQLGRSAEAAVELETAERHAARDPGAAPALEFARRSAAQASPRP